MISREMTTDLIVQEYRETKTAYAVARKFGINIKTVYNQLSKAKEPIIGTIEYRNNSKACTPIQEKEIVELYVSGSHISELSVRFSVGKYAIASCLKRHGIDRRKRGNWFKQFSQETKDSIMRLYVEEKLSQQKIEKIVGVTQNQISRYLRKQGIKTRLKSDRHPSFKGGRIIQSGYVAILVYSDEPFYEMSNNMGYVLEHRIVMARHLNRTLEKGETVHHIDGNKLNNSLDNLQLRSGKHGSGACFRCASCGSYDVRATKIK